MKLRERITTAAAYATRALASTARWLVSPGVVAAALLLVGCASMVAGVFVLAGLGWSLIAASVPTFAAGALLVRGMINGQ